MGPAGFTAGFGVGTGGAPRVVGAGKAPGDARRSRLGGTIMGPAGLTAVFGMGTGGAPPVWSPGKRPAGGRGRAGRVLAFVRSSVTRSRGGSGAFHHHDGSPEGTSSRVAGRMRPPGRRGGPPRR